MDDKQLVEELMKRPTLREQLERFLQIAMDHDISLADEAEEATVAACRKMGQATLHLWAQSREATARGGIEKRVNSARKDKKKSLLANDVGTNNG